MNWVNYAIHFIIFPGFLFTAVGGLLVVWIDRKVTARVQWRVGPPWYQPFVDVVKLLGKETIVPEQSRRGLFLVAPLIGLVGVTLVSTMVFTMGLYPDRSFVGDLIVVIYFLAFPALGAVLAGSSSRNPLSAVGASREMTLYFAYELPLLIALFSSVVKADGIISIGGLVTYQELNGAFLYSLSGVISFVVALLCTQAKLTYAPFDIPEAETEIMAGPYLEYSGVPLAAFKLTRAMMLFVLPVFLITMFWGGLTSWWAVGKYLIIVVLIVLIKNTNPRVRIDQAVRFFWFPITILAIIGMALAFYGL